MSDAGVSALSGASAQGFAEVRDMGLQGMITLRADLSAGRVKKELRAALGGDLPGAGHIVPSDAGHAAWMSPDELLVLVPYAAVPTRLKEIARKMEGFHHLAVDVSDARCLFAVSGEDALVREALAKLMPVNLAPAAFAPGRFRRSRMAQVPAALWFEGPGEARVVCFRSVAQYVFDLLEGATAPGSEVRHLAE